MKIPELRRILKNVFAQYTVYLAISKNGSSFQQRFFQIQNDLKNISYIACTCFLFQPKSRHWQRARIIHFTLQPRKHHRGVMSFAVEADREGVVPLGPGINTRMLGATSPLKKVCMLCCMHRKIVYACMNFSHQKKTVEWQNHVEVLFAKVGDACGSAVFTTPCRESPVGYL